METIERIFIKAANKEASLQPDYEAEKPINNLPDALAVLLADKVQDLDISDIYDFFKSLNL